MKTKKRLVIGLTVVGASFPLALGCSSESTDGGTGGAAGSGGAAGAAAGTTPTGGSGASMSGSGGTSGATTGGTSGATSGGTAGATTGGTAGASATGGSGAAAGAGQGGGGASGGMGGAGQGGANGGAGAGGKAGGGGSGGAGGGGAGGKGGSGGASGFTLTSPDHMEGAMFAAPYTCAMAGFNGSIIPELRWSGAPSGTMSFAITFIDRTLAPTNMNGYHWVIWNIPATVMTLPEGFKDQASIGAMENRDFLGPCPNFSGGSAMTDTYEFTIYALAQASISPTGNMTAIVANAETMLEANNLAKAKLSGRSNASPP